MRNVYYLQNTLGTRALELDKTCRSIGKQRPQYGRARIGVDTALNLPPGPNSGLSGRI